MHHHTPRPLHWIACLFTAACSVADADAQSHHRGRSAGPARRARRRRAKHSRHADADRRRGRVPRHSGHRGSPLRGSGAVAARDHPAGAKDRRGTDGRGAAQPLDAAHHQPRRRAGPGDRLRARRHALVPARRAPGARPGRRRTAAGQGHALARAAGAVRSPRTARHDAAALASRHVRLAQPGRHAARHRRLGPVRRRPVGPGRPPRVRSRRLHPVASERRRARRRRTSAISSRRWPRACRRPTPSCRAPSTCSSSTPPSRPRR